MIPHDFRGSGIWEGLSWLWDSDRSQMVAGAGTVAGVGLEQQSARGSLHMVQGPLHVTSAHG